VEDVISVRDCEVYAYTPDMEDDPFSDGNLWSFNYFFFNRNLKRILYFTCIARSRFADDGAWQASADTSLIEGDGEDEAGAEGDDGDEVLGEMDL
jgi:hypothetical protein